MRVIAYRTKSPGLARFTSLRLGVARRGSMDDGGSGGEIVFGEPAADGDNYQFTEFDSDFWFGLKVNGAPEMYIMYSTGTSGLEQIQVEAGAVAPVAPTPLDMASYYEFGNDGYFKLYNQLTSFRNKLKVYDGQFQLDGPDPSLPTSMPYIVGHNFRFNGTLFQLKDFATGLWYTPWIILSGGLPVLELQPV